jgi:hypothetical protein
MICCHTLKAFFAILQDSSVLDVPSNRTLF